MKTVVIQICIVLAVLFSAINAESVDFQEEIRRLAEDNARGYIGPFATAFGTGMNSGFYHTAKPHKVLGFDINVRVALMQVAKEDLEYDFYFPKVPFPLTHPINNQVDTLVINLQDFYPDRKTSTVFGSNPANELTPDITILDEVILQAMENAGWDSLAIELLLDSPIYDEFKNNIAKNIRTFTSVPGIGLDYFPFVMPQVSVGLPMKTEVMLRFMPEIELTDIGKVKFTGIGVKHSISQYIPIPMFPVDITAQFVWQKLEIGELIESTHIGYNLHASKRVGLPLLSITPYVGFGVESSDLKLAYTIENKLNPFGEEVDLEGTEVKFDLKGDNKTRLTMGARLGFTLFTISAEYSVGAYNVLTVGAGLTLR